MTQQVVETPDVGGAFPRLSGEQLAAMRPYGTPRRVEPDEVLIRAGERYREFMVILSGQVASYEAYGTREQRLLRVDGPGRFLGELGVFTGQPAYVSSVAREAGEVLVVPGGALREAAQRDTALADLILRAFIYRRDVLVDVAAGIRIIGSRFSPDARRLREFAARNRLPYTWIDLEEDPQAVTLLHRLGVPADQTPVVICQGEAVLRNPSNADLARVLGLPPPRLPDEPRDLVVVGAGPAGLAAAVYGASEGLSTVVLDAVATGGQAGTSSRIENYLGFPNGISGAELADRAVIQAEKFGALVSVPAEAVRLDRDDGCHLVRLDGGDTIRARTVVIATGCRYRRLEVPRLAEFEGTSVYYAATVMEARQCRQRPVAVVGGGNSAGQASLFLARHAVRVNLLIRHDDLGRDMSHYLVEQIERAPGVEVFRNTEVRELTGRDGELDGIVAADTRTGRSMRLDADLLFVFIGTQPCTGWLAGDVALDGHGYVRTGPAAAGESRDGPDPTVLETSRPGVYAVGDVRSGSIKRVASAAGEGAMSVRLIHDHLARAGRTAGR